MSKEFIDNRIDMAHNLIDEGNPLNAITLLKNLKLRIHSDEVADKIKEFESKTDKDIEDGLYSINVSDKDELRKDHEKRNLMMDWAKRYLDFYDDLVKGYEI